MATVNSSLSELLEPLGQCLTPDVARKFAGLRAPDSVQARMDQLAGKNTEGTLSSDERAELESLVSAGTFIAILQSKARLLLKRVDGSNE